MTFGIHASTYVRPRPPIATIGARFWANFVDGLAVGLPIRIAIALVAFLFAVTGVINPDAARVGYYIVAYVLSEGLLAIWIGVDGSTPGKRMHHVRVVDHRDYRMIGVGRALLRAAAEGALAATIIGGIADILVACFSEDHRSLHDRIARSIVIEVP